jgi:Ca2+-binding RTX toxin-like protein
VFNGFYIDDRYGGAFDIPELNLTGKIVAGVLGGIKGDFGIGKITAGVGLEGGIFANLGLDLKDPDGDGKIYFDEFKGLFDSGGVINIFDHVGSFDAGLDAFAKIELEVGKDPFKIKKTLLDKTKSLARVTLVDYNTPSFSASNLATQNGGDVIVSTGADDDNIRVGWDSAANTLLVSNGSRLQKFTNVTSISIDSGDGNDTIVVDASVPKPVTLRGGTGNDRLVAGSAKAFLYGDDGDDILEGGSGDDTIEGGSGNDTIRGNGGKDTIKGGSGNDQIDGGEGNDTIDGDAGNDIIRGGSGTNILNGGAGDDIIDGGTDDDFITGGADNDTITGRRRNQHH